MLYILIINILILCTVDDVSAQTSCVINPNITTLTIADGLTRDVEFHCQCMDDNGIMITGTRWLLFDGTSAPTQDFNIPPVVLFLPSPFNDTYAGTYICSPNKMIHLEIQLLLVQEVSIYISSYMYVCTVLLKENLIKTCG